MLISVRDCYDCQLVKMTMKADLCPLQTVSLSVCIDGRPALLHTWLRSQMLTFSLSFNSRVQCMFSQ